MVRSQVQGETIERLVEELSRLFSQVYLTEAFTSSAMLHFTCIKYNNVFKIQLCASAYNWHYLCKLQSA